MTAEDRKAFIADAEAKQAAYAASRRAWAAVPKQVAAVPKPEPRTADTQAVVDATQTGG